MKLDTLLKLLAASKSDELRIEPDAQPYFTTPTGKKNASEVVMTAATVSAIIFPAIPVEEKMRLPNVPQVSFSLSNEAGNFAVVVTKSSNGLSVKINHLNSTVSSGGANAVPPPGTSNANAAAAINTSSAAPNVAVGNNKSNGQTSESAVKSKSLFGSLQSAFMAGAKSKESSETAAFAAREEKPAPINQINPVAASNAQPSAVVAAPPISATAVPKAAPASPPNPLTQTPPPTVNQYAPKIVLPEIDDESFAPETIAPALTQQHNAETVSRLYENGGDLQPKQKMDALFYKMAEVKASDLHLSVSSPPMIRKDGKMAILDESHPVLTADSMRELLWSIIPEKNREEFERRHDTDFAYEIADLARFRANIFQDRKGMGAVFRIIPTKILTAEQLGLSSAILDLCNLSKGLVVVTGPTGSGKSTTLCAMVDHINKSREDHIITIEDPIEFTHENKKCLVNQREVHNHTDSFKDALRAALREDPDILLVGEMRDLETISIAIETAETGHLVFGTLHTTTAPSTVDRIIDQFPADRQQQIRVMLSESLKGVIAQTLLPKKGGGRIAALEILIVTPAISNLIREGKTFQIASSMQTGKQHGMVILNDALFDLVKKGLVEPRDAYIKAVDKIGFDAMLKRNNVSL